MRSILKIFFFSKQHSINKGEIVTFESVVKHFTEEAGKLHVTCGSAGCKALLMPLFNIDINKDLRDGLKYGFHAMAIKAMHVIYDFILGDENKTEMKKSYENFRKHTYEKLLTQELLDEIICIIDATVLYTKDIASTNQMSLSNDNVLDVKSMQIKHEQSVTSIIANFNELKLKKKKAEDDFNVFLNFIDKVENSKKNNVIIGHQDFKDELNRTLNDFASSHEAYYNAAKATKKAVDDFNNGRKELAGSLMNFGIHKNANPTAHGGR